MGGAKASDPRVDGRRRPPEDAAAGRPPYQGTGRREEGVAGLAPAGNRTGGRGALAFGVPVGKPVGEGGTTTVRARRSPSDFGDTRGHDGEACWESPRGEPTELTEEDREVEAGGLGRGGSSGRAQMEGTPGRSEGIRGGREIPKGEGGGGRTRGDDG